MAAVVTDGMEVGISTPLKQKRQLMAAVVTDGMGVLGLSSPHQSNSQRSRKTLHHPDSIRGSTHHWERCSSTKCGSPLSQINAIQDQEMNGCICFILRADWLCSCQLVMGRLIPSADCPSSLWLNFTAGCGLSFIRDISQSRF